MGKRVEQSYKNYSIKVSNSQPHSDNPSYQGDILDGVLIITPTQKK